MIANKPRRRFEFTTIRRRRGDEDLKRQLRQSARGDEEQLLALEQIFSRSEKRLVERIGAAEIEAGLNAEGEAQM